MTLKAAVQHFPIAICSVLALASVADAQTSSLTGAETSSVGGAEKLSYGVDAGLGETDNVNLTSNNKVYQTLSVVDVDFDVKHKSRRLDVDAKGNFTDYDYLQGAYGNQLLGRADGIAHLALIPQRLTWVLQDDYGQAVLDPYAPTTPGNIESINYVSTGPDLALRVGGRGFFDLSVRLARADYQISPFSGNRVLGSAAAGLQLSPRSSVSLNGVAERVLFDNTKVNGDIDRTSAYVRYDIQGARTSLSVDLGATKVNESGAPFTAPISLGRGVPTTGPLPVSQSPVTTTGPLARLSITRQLSQAATLTLSGGREITDGTSSFSGIQGGAIGIVGTASAGLTSSPFTTNFASADWEYKRNRTTIGVSGNWARDVYPDRPQFDLTGGGVEFNVGRKLTRTLALQVVGRYGKTDYVHSNLLPLLGTPKYDDKLLAAALSWRHGRALEVRIRAEHSTRTPGYQENRIFLTVGYRPESNLAGESEPERLQSIDRPGA